MKHKNDIVQVLDETIFHDPPRGVGDGIPNVHMRNFFTGIQREVDKASQEDHLNWDPEFSTKRHVRRLVSEKTMEDKIYKEHASPN